MLLCYMKQIALVASYDTTQFDFSDFNFGDVFSPLTSAGTLTDTRWHLVSDRVRMTIDFGPGGNAICVDDSGLGTLVSWAETEDNHFVVQWDQGLCGARINETLFGVYGGDQGSGMFYSSVGILEGFKMTKD